MYLNMDGFGLMLMILFGTGILFYIWLVGLLIGMIRRRRIGLVSSLVLQCLPALILFIILFPDDHLGPGSLLFGPLALVGSWARMGDYAPFLGVIVLYALPLWFLFLSLLAILAWVRRWLPGVGLVTLFVVSMVTAELVAVSRQCRALPHGHEAVLARRFVVQSSYLGWRFGSFDVPHAVTEIGGLPHLFSYRTLEWVPISERVDWDFPPHRRRCRV